MQRVYYLDLVLVPLVCITYYLFFITYYFNVSIRKKPTFQLSLN